MAGRGAFRADIPGFEKCVLCKNENNGIEHVVNYCPIIKNEREKALKELKKLDANTSNKTLLEIIYYWYYTKDYSNAKEIMKKDNRGIKVIKEFIFSMYKSFGVMGKRDADVFVDKVDLNED